MEKQTVIKWLNGHITDKTTVADKEIVDYLKKLVKAEESRKNDTEVKEWEQYFEKCWEYYPRKVGKCEAKKVFERKVRKLSGEKLKEKVRNIFTKEIAYRKYVIEKETETQFIKHFASWLNSEFENL